MVDSYIHVHSRRAWEPGCRISLVLWLLHLRVYAISSFPVLSGQTWHQDSPVTIISSNLCANTNRYCSLPFMTAAVLVLVQPHSQSPLSVYHIQCECYGRTWE